MFDAMIMSHIPERDQYIVHFLTPTHKDMKVCDRCMSPTISFGIQFDRQYWFPTTRLAHIFFAGIVVSKENVIVLTGILRMQKMLANILHPIMQD